MAEEYKLRTEHLRIELLVGAVYDLDARTVGELKSYLRQMIGNLPDDNSLEIDEVWSEGSKIGYSLKKGIPE